MNTHLYHIIYSFSIKMTINLGHSRSNLNTLCQNVNHRFLYPSVQSEIGFLNVKDSKYDSLSEA